MSTFIEYWPLWMVAVVLCFKMGQCYGEMKLEEEWEAECSRAQFQELSNARRG